MNECNSEHRDMFSLPLMDGVLLNIELYSCNAFLSINSTLNIGLSIWWIAKAHNKMHFIMYMWQPHLLLKYLPNTIMLLKSSKINIKSQPQVRNSFLLNNGRFPQLHTHLEVQVFRPCPEFTGNYFMNYHCQMHLLSTDASAFLRNNWSSNLLLSRQHGFHSHQSSPADTELTILLGKKKKKKLVIHSDFHINFYPCLYC